MVRGFLMNTKHDQYVPILKWMQGEYIALEKLDSKSRKKLCPLFIIPPVQFDFDEWRPKHSIQEHIEPMPSRILKKWGKGKAFIDFHNSLLLEKLENHQNVSEYVFSELTKENCLCVPTLRLNYPEQYLYQIKNICRLTGNGVLLRVAFEDLMTPNLSETIQLRLELLELSANNTDLLIDIGEPESFEPYPVFSKALNAAILRIPELRSFRSFIFSGMSLKISTIKKPGGEHPRHEWLLYQTLVKDLAKVRCPTYADYTIERPDFIQEDMRKLKPGGKIIYTTPKSWFISKGGQFRGNEEQMITHCQNVVKSGYYCEPDYCFGDKRIMDTIEGKDNTGNLGTWKKVGINHHLKLVVDQLAKFHAA